ncbi:hypothetical protein FQN54_000026 [Arachnomyces sp. PD_36]|nr:hypothetical protein FQN54_000026 [Arachnomyces sp. PD_36]
MRTPPLQSPAKAPSPVAPSQNQNQNHHQSLSRTLDSPDEQSPSMQQHHDQNLAAAKNTNLLQCDPALTPPSTQDLKPEPCRDQPEQTMQTLESLKKKMEETLVSQQKQNRNPPRPTLKIREDGYPSRTSSQSYNTHTPSDHSSSDNSDGQDPSTESVSSSHTVRASGNRKTPNHTSPNTPSYPFPAMELKLPMDKTKRQSVDETLRPTILSPVNAKAGRRSASSTNIPSLPEYNVPPSRSSFLPPGAAAPVDDPTYPSPNLYDISLALNADPGLDSWWSNAVQVLEKYYGAERATLAIPGDVTDLENVPWGQKASFNIDGLRGPSSSSEELFGEVGDDGNKTPQEAPSLSKKKDEDVVQSTMKTPPPHAKRPDLLSRHSFAGFGKQGNESSPLDSEVSPRTRPAGPLRTKSTVGPEGKLSTLSSEKPSSASQSSTTKEEQEQTAAPKRGVDFSESQTRSRPLVVFSVPRALEVEADPLIKRTGVVKLFGRTKPTALTREYTHTPPSHPDSATTNITAGDRAQTPSKAPEPLKESVKLDSRARSSSNINANAPNNKPKREHSSIRHPPYLYDDDLSAHTPTSTGELYEEYEQSPPSPWSQSPAPSPAPRAMPEHDPFFSHTIDEEAFTSTPPSHDYSQKKPPHAIGMDQAKTLIHIPLVHSPSSRQTTSTPLRFPVAVISILTSIIPYPANLMHSLTYLLPHLTTSYCLAQQYSQLEKQMMSSTHQRYSHILGLGGTFSDESSEMELVAGLSGHVNYALGDDSHPNMSGPDAAVNSSERIGSPITDAAALDLANIEIQEAIRRSPVQGEQYSSFEQVMGPSGSLARSRSTQAIAKPRQLSNKLTGRPNEIDRPDVAAVATPPHENNRYIVNTIAGPNSRHASPTTIAGHIARDAPRPFSDYIAQLMLNSVPLHLFLAKPHTGEVIWTNAKFDAYRRSQPHEQRLRDPWQNVHAVDRDNLAKEWSKALRTGSQFTERVRVKRFNDETAYRWFIFRANPLISNVGELNYWIGSFLDVHEQHITEMKAAQEREVFATDAKFRALANSIPQVVFEATEYRGLISANEQWHLYTGQTLDDALNLGFAKHVHRDDLEKCGMFSYNQSEPGSRDSTQSPHESETMSSSSSGRTARAGSADSGYEFPRGVTPALQELVDRGVVAVQRDENGRVSYSTEVRLRSRGGDFRWHLVRLVKVETTSFGSGEASWYGTCTDINDRKLLERELNKAMQKLNREMESKTKFFSNMSHEIRTPLNGILGTIPFILDTHLDNDQRRMLDTIQNSSTNLRGLVDNILDVSKVEAGKMNLVKAWFHVRSVVEDVIDTIGSRAIDKGLELNYLFDVDVPPMVVGDRFRIRQVLINLMGNAVKFTSQGEIYTRCSVFQDPEATNLGKTELLLNFEVTDTGKGFSATDAVRLMQRFSQIEGTSSQQHAGSGLGLFLSKQLVEMHGGRLTPEGREGQGAKFSFFVKVDVPTAPSPEEEAPEKTHSRSVSAVHENPSSPTKARIPLTSSDSHDSKNSDKQTTSTGLGSPAFPSTASSVRSTFDHRSDRSSSLSSALATPELVATQSTPAKSGLASVERETLSSLSGAQDSASTVVTRKQSVRVPGHGSDPAKAASEALSSSSYAILIICPLDHAREAIKQHIEQVIPLDVASNIISVPDVDDWKDLMSSGECPKLTHLILSIPDANEVTEAMQHVQLLDKTAPSVVLIADMYQKRAVNTRYEELEATGRPVHLVPKPVKPSAFSNIFDPDNKRDLSKDRNQDMAREVNNNFKTMSKIVKEVIGNKGYRILLVEDDETNRGVMLKYLDKVKLASETAANGQECVEMVFSKEPGYYSLIICDIQMPVKNGYDTCQEIRDWEQTNHYPQIPIMALSANAMMEQIDDAARAGFNDYVTKPIKHNELGKMMMTLLDPSVPTGLLRDRKPNHQFPPS